MPPSFPAGSYPAAVVADGAVAYWRLGESSGTMASDSVGTVHGTISGGVTLGQAGALADGDKAMLFDGTTGGVLAPTGAYQTFGTGPLTIECWCRFPTAPAPFTYPLDMKADGSANAGPQFYVTDTNFGFQVYNTLGGVATAQAAIIAAAVADGFWRHCVAVLSRGPDEVRLYINGALANGPNAFPAGTIVSATDGCGIGFATTSAHGFFNGEVDEVAIYPTALTAPQIAAHYAAKDWTAFTFGPAYQEMRYRWCRYVPSRVRR
jgi:Concanavalin A-like lectin/glucanases superfamily